MRGKTALHDLTDPGKWDWGNLDVIPYLNPSKMMLLKFCPRLFSWKVTKRLGGPQIINNSSVPMIQGALYHAMAEAHDLGNPVLKVLHDHAEKIRADPQYVVSFSDTLDYLVAEMFQKWYPKYQKFMELHVEPYFETLWTERELHVPLSKFVLSCVPDKVVLDTETDEIWVVERKTTMRNDAAWDKKWALNAQTTAEVIAVEKTLDKPVAGVYLEQVVVTRKRSATWTNRGIPQPISTHTQYPWRPVPKSKYVKEEFIRFGESIVDEIRWRNTTGHEWDANYANCERCEAKDICLGRRHSTDVLVALEEDYASKAQRLAHGISQKTTSQVITATVKKGSDGI